MEENSFNLSDLENKSLSDLQDLARELGLTNAANSTRKDELISRVLQVQTDRNGLIHAKGILEILPDGWGFLRRSNFSPNAEDIYVSQTQIKRFGLKTGDEVSGQVRPPKESEKYYGLLRVEAVNQLDPDTARTRRDFDDLTPTYPDERLVLETTKENISARFIDLTAPIGKGQRGLIVSPPKAGKTTMLKTIA